MNNSQIKTSGPRGFTLIELLVVIAIIGILAGLLLATTGKVKQKMAITRVQAELAILQTAIESYKVKMGHYPPDNPANFAQNQLYFELSGCFRTNILGVDCFMTLDRAAKIPVASVAAVFGQGGIMNTSSGAGGDEAGTAYRLLKEIKPTQYGETVAGTGIRVLGVLVDGPPPSFPASGGNTLNPFRYNSSSPTNNQNSFDLWVDVVFGKKTNRVNNWKSTPTINP